jgi:cell division protein FtsW
MMHVPPAPSDTRRRSRRPKGAAASSGVAPEAVLSIAILMLVCIGVVMVYSASSASALLENSNPSEMLIRQGLFALVALVAFAVCARVSPATILKLGKPAVFVALGLLVVVLIPGFGIEANGARSWIGLGPIQLQPSEFAKLALVVWLAAYLARNVDRLHSWEGLKRPIGIMVAMGFLLMLEPDLGTTIVLLSAAFLMLAMAGVPARWLGGMLAAAAAATVALTIVAPYRMARVTSFLDPWSDPEGNGFQVVQAQLALGSGGMGGVGLGNGMQKVNYLPEAHTDMIMATIGEELGLIGVLGVIALVGAVIWSGYRIALAAPDLRLRLMAGGLVSLISIQAVVNLGAVLGVLPVTGVPLPFVSYGGSSLVVLTAASGILVGISRRSRARRLSVVAPQRSASGGDRRGRDGRAHHAGAGAG